MRILLDESVPARLDTLLTGHACTSVQRRGWAGVRTGRLLALASGEYDVPLTADRGIEHQQNLATLPIAVMIVVAPSNRLSDIAPLAGRILDALSALEPRSFVEIAG